MSDIVARLRDWRNVHLARLHLLMEEAADEVARLRSDNSRRANLEQGLRDGIVRLSANGDCPASDNAARQDNDERLAALQALAAVDEELGLPRRTPDTLATPREGREQDGCTLTDAERAALQWFGHYGLPEHHAATLVALLERTLPSRASDKPDTGAGPPP